MIKLLKGSVEGVKSIMAAAKKTNKKKATAKKAAKKAVAKKATAKKAAAKKVVKKAAKKAVSKPAKKVAKKAAKKVAKKAASKKTAVKKAVAKKAAKKAVKKAAAKKVAKKAVKKAAAKPQAKKATTKAKATASQKSSPAKTTSKTVKGATQQKPATLSKKSSNKKTAVAVKPVSSKPKVEKKRVRNEVRQPQAPLSDTPIHGQAPYIEKKGEEYMNPAQKEHFSKILIAWKSELMEEADVTVNHLKDESTNLPDLNDRATQEEEFSLELRTRDRERKLLKKIQKAVDKLKTDDFGYCEECGIEIGIRRLEARPTAELCIDCKNLSEIKEKQING